MLFYGRILHGKNKQVIVRQAIKIKIYETPHHKREKWIFLLICVDQPVKKINLLIFLQSCFQTLISVHLLRGQLLPPNSFWDWMGKTQGSNALLSDYLLVLSSSEENLLGGREKTYTLSHFILFLYLHVLVRGAVKTNRETSIGNGVKKMCCSQCSVE